MSLPHIGALDGLRGVAVAGVLLYHGGHLKGGYLGVDLFFVLSGYLITSLLLAEWRRTDHVSLSHFWARRARRLLPALALVLLGVALYCVVFANPAELTRIRGDALATIAYVANWRAIFAHQSYFDLFLAPSPLQHTWSLAIEEQFYLLWPLIFVGLAAWWKRKTAMAVLVTAVTCGIASTVLMAAVYSKANTNRAYYGTDTRSFALFAGITIAAAVAIWGFPRDRITRIAVEAVAIVGVLVLAVMWTTLDGQAPRLYQGGFAVAGIAAALVIAAAAHPTRGPINRVLSLAPLRGLGLISYGLYLWHWPVDIVMSPERIGLTGWPLFALQTAVALAIALASYSLIEMPIRRGALTPRQWRIATPAIATALVAALVLTTASTSAGSTSNGDQSAGSGAGARVVLFGDSVAHSLRPGLVDAGLDPIVWWSGGCRLIHGQVSFPSNFSGDCPWEAGISAITKAYEPTHAILLMGAWDLFDVKPNGTNSFVGPGSAGWDAAFRRQLEGAIARAGHTGAKVTVLTIPCVSPLTSAATSYQPGAFAIPRVQAANRVISETVAAHRDSAEVVDLYGFLCPGDSYRSTVKGVVTRSDGVHLSKDGADLVANWLIPRLHLEADPKPTTGASPSVLQSGPKNAIDAMKRQYLELQKLALDQAVNTASPRVVLAGDSMAFSLATGANQAHDAPVGVLGVGMVGCGIERGTPVGPRFTTPTSVCRQWPMFWNRAIDVADARALLLLTGVWDMWDRNVSGHHQAMYSSALRRNLLGQLERARTVAAHRNIPLILLTVPCLAPNAAEAAQVAPGLGDPHRVRWLNATYAEFAKQHPDVTLIPFGEHVCAIKPSPLSDGVHLSVPGAVDVWKWLTPQIQRVIDTHGSTPTSTTP